MCNNNQDIPAEISNHGLLIEIGMRLRVKSSSTDKFVSCELVGMRCGKYLILRILEDDYPDEFHKPLKFILQPTSGVILYHEQVLYIFNKIASFTKEQAVISRYIIYKNYKIKIKKIKKRFIKNRVQNGYKKENCKKLYNILLKYSTI